jgi:hypothetical protein
MELLYSYKFWKQLTKKYETSPEVCFCPIDVEFQRLWSEEETWTQIRKFAKDFYFTYHNEFYYYVGCNILFTVPIYTQFNSTRELRKQFLEYMMLRMAHSEKDV